MSNTSCRARVPRYVWRRCDVGEGVPAKQQMVDIRHHVAERHSGSHIRMYGGSADLQSHHRRDRSRGEGAGAMGDEDGEEGAGAVGVRRRRGVAVVSAIYSSAEISGLDGSSVFVEESLDNEFHQHPTLKQYTVSIKREGRQTATVRL